MKFPGELLRERFQQESIDHLGVVIQEMFRKGLLTRMWIDPVTHEVFAA